MAALAKYSASAFRLFRRTALAGYAGRADALISALDASSRAECFRNLAALISAAGLKATRGAVRTGVPRLRTTIDWAIIHDRAQRAIEDFQPAGTRYGLHSATGGTRCIDLHESAVRILLAATVRLLDSVLESLCRLIGISLVGSSCVRRVVRLCRIGSHGVAREPLFAVQARE